MADVRTGTHALMRYHLYPFQAYFSSIQYSLRYGASISLLSPSV